MIQRIFIFVLGLVACSGLWAQKVGVNTRTPRYSLDVEGGLKVSDIPERTDVQNLSLIKWLPYDSGASQDKQGLLVTAENTPKTYKAFEMVDYYFYLNDTNNDHTNNIDLEIPTDRYSVFLTECDLLKVKNEKDFQNDYRKLEPALLPCVILKGVDPKAVPTYREFAFSSKLAHHGLPNDDSGYGAIHFPLPNVHLYKDISRQLKKETWHFYADYPLVGPVSFDLLDRPIKDLGYGLPLPIRKNIAPGEPSAPRYPALSRLPESHYVWAAKMLIVDNEYMDVLPDVIVDLNKKSGAETPNPKLGIDVPQILK